MVWDLQLGEAGLSSFRGDGGQRHHRMGLYDRQPHVARPANPRTCAWRSTPLLFCHGPREAASYELKAKPSLIYNLSLDLSLEKAFGIREKFLPPRS